MMSAKKSRQPSEVKMMSAKKRHQPSEVKMMSAKKRHQPSKVKHQIPFLNFMHQLPSFIII
jgi:hypothetical protein